MIEMPHIQEIIQSVFEGVRGSGSMAPVYFVAVYILATFLFVPIFFLGSAGGFLFGAIPGAFLSAFAALFSSAIVYLISHNFLRNWVNVKIEKYRSLKIIDQVIHSGSWRVVILLRLAPVLPFIPLNLSFGVSKIKFLKFVSASFIGFLPGSFLCAYVGSIAGSLIGFEERTPIPGEQYFFLLSATAAILATVYVTKLTRQALASNKA